VAFIGDNFPGDKIDADLNSYFAMKERIECFNIIDNIFETATGGSDYIQSRPYKSLTGKFYGNIYACDLSDVNMPEMKLVRDFYMEGAPADKKWKLLKTTTNV
jgi:hypothetical protein